MSQNPTMKRIETDLFQQGRFYHQKRKDIRLNYEIRYFYKSPAGLFSPGSH